MGHLDIFSKNLRQHNPTIRLVGQYVNARTPVDVKCSVCGYNWTCANVYHLSKGLIGCPSCNNRVPITRSRVQAELDDLTAGTCKVLTDVSRTRDLVTTLCTTCGHETTCMVSNLLSRRRKGFGCQHCSRKLQERAMTNQPHKHKDVVIGRKRFSLQGYEPQAIQWILRCKLAKASELVTGVRNVPRILYRLKGRQHYHYPDIWIPSQNRLVEVKSRYTLLGKEHYFKMTAAKCRAAKRAGYQYVLLLMDAEGRRTKLPKEWHTMSYSKIKAIV